MSADGVIDGSLYGGDGGEVGDGLTVLGGALDDVRVCHIADDQFDVGVMWQVFAFSRGEVIEHTNEKVVGQQGFHEMGADESGASRNEDGGLCHGIAGFPGR